MMSTIPFNKPYCSKNELNYIKDSIKSGKISGNGMFSKRCQTFFKEKFNFQNTLLTSSCTDALEMSAILIDIQPGDEVILPSYTFVSTANAFVLRGAKIVFVDSRNDHPGMDEDRIEELITKKTKAIVAVHYAGVACDMNKLKTLADNYKIFLIEDAAQAIDSYYGRKEHKKPLGSFGHLSTFSFHETKNIISGEGGMLVINEPKLVKRAEIIWEKGTNRSAFFRGEIDKYGWVDVGSSFLPSDITAAYLFAQLEELEKIQSRRKRIWEIYDSLLNNKSELFSTPIIPSYATNNGHMYYLTLKNQEDRLGLISFLKSKGILVVFHYQSLHQSEFGKIHFPTTNKLANSDRYSNSLVRLPLFMELENEQIIDICNLILEYFKKS